MSIEFDLLMIEKAHNDVDELQKDFKYRRSDLGKSFGSLRNAQQQEIKVCSAQEAERQSDYAYTQSVIEANNNKRTTAENAINTYNSRINTAQNKIKSETASLAKLKSTLSSTKPPASTGDSALDSQLKSQYESTVSQLKSEIKEANEHIKEYEALIDELKAKIVKLRKIIAAVIENEPKLHAILSQLITMKATISQHKYELVSTKEALYAANDVLDGCFNRAETECDRIGAKMERAFYNASRAVDSLSKLCTYAPSSASYLHGQVVLDDESSLIDIINHMKKFVSESESRASRLSSALDRFLAALKDNISTDTSRRAKQAKSALTNITITINDISNIIHEAVRYLEAYRSSAG